MSKTVTDARLLNSLKNVNTIINSDNVSKEIETKVAESIALKGKLVRFYPRLDKAKVKIENEEVMAWVLHKCCGNTWDFYTPNGEQGYDTTLNTVFIDPLDKSDCLVLKIKGNKNEYVLLGYLSSGNLQPSVPAEPNTWQIINFGFPELFSLKFQNGYFDVLTRNGIKVDYSNYGEGDEIIFADEKDTYSKEEVDELIKKLKEDNGLV